MTGLHRVVVVGASTAGLTAAETLREKGYDGRLTLVGGETHLPYERPPLSKQVLTGDWPSARTAFRADGDYRDLGADWLLGCRATELDAAGRRVTLDDGSVLPYDALVIATGVRPRRLRQGHELSGVHVLRTLDDAVALREAFGLVSRVVIVGAGFLGGEIAASAQARSLDVTLVEPAPTPMHRHLGPAVGDLVAALHTSRGVRVRTGVTPVRLIGAGGRVTGVELSDGSVLDAELVVVAIGATPAVDWLAGSGLPLGDGVLGDEYCRAAPGVYAAGDVASWLDPRSGRRRLEHRMHAAEQAAVVARNILGANERFTPTPYVWSNQYDCMLQAYGWPGHDLETAVVEGDPGEDRFVSLYARDGRVVGALGWNSPRSLRAFRRHVVAESVLETISGIGPR